MGVNLRDDGFEERRGIVCIVVNFVMNETVFVWGDKEDVCTRYGVVLVGGREL